MAHDKNKIDEFDDIKMGSDNANLMKELIEAIQSQQSRFVDLQNRLGRIESALLGDAEMGSPGFIRRHKELETAVLKNKEVIQQISDYHDIKQKVEENEERINKIYWAVSIAAGAISVAINIGIKVFL